MAEITMRPSEMRGVREAMRTMSKLVRSLNDGEVEKYVLTKRGRVIAILLDVDDYSEMVEKAKVRNAQPHIPGDGLHQSAQRSCHLPEVD